MPDAKVVLLGVLCLLTAAFVAMWAISVRQARRRGDPHPGSASPPKGLTPPAQFAITGVLIGAAVGYLFGPARDFDNVPFLAVLTRGAIMEMDPTAQAIARSGFNIMLLGGIVGGAAGWILGFVFERLRFAFPPGAPTFEQSATGFLTNFFDTLGIGSFATTTTIFRLRNMVPDEQIPGTLNVGHTPPTVTQALIYIALLGGIVVEMRTLVLMIGAAVAGAWLGAGVVAGLPRRKIQIGMGFALFVAALLMLRTQLAAGPADVGTSGVTGAKLAIALTGNFVLGALMTLGIGLYAPCMILVSMLGMNPVAAFPIMMGSCAFLMPIGSIQFINKRSYNLKAALGLAFGGVPAVLMAAYIVKSLPLDYVRWLVILVVLYTAAALLRAARTEQGTRDARSTAPANA